MTGSRAAGCRRCSRRRSVAPDRHSDSTDTVVGLARTLRAAGVDASPDRVHALMAALSVLDPALRADVYWAGRLTLCSGADDVRRYDRVFAAYFGDRPAALVRRPTVPAAQLRLFSMSTDDATAAGEQGEGESTPVPAAASSTEILRHRDIASLSADDRVLLARLLAAFALPGELRRTRRTTPGLVLFVDRRRTLHPFLPRRGAPVE